MKATIISILISVVLIGGALWFMNSRGQNGEGQANNTSIVDGKQIIKINAKGGYRPRLTYAKAEMPTTLKVRTQGTFDCSSALVIPSLNYRRNLQPSGETEIEIPPQKAGTVMKGLCSMGMYNFQIRFD